MQYHVAIEAGPVVLSEEMLDLVSGGGGHWDPNDASTQNSSNIFPGMDPDG